MIACGKEGEVVLTFGDGPWPKNTQAVLAALASHWHQGDLFSHRTHATYEPAVLKQVAAAEHAIGLHTWCHPDLPKTKGTCLVRGKRESVEYDPNDEIEKGISAVRWAVGGPTTPYFRFPALLQPPELIEYPGKRNIGIFLRRLRFLELQDAQARAGQTVRDGQLKKHGKGIVLMHDFQHATAEATADLLKDPIQALDRRAHHCLAQSLGTHYGPALQRCTPLPHSEELAGAIRQTAHCQMSTPDHHSSALVGAMLLKASHC
jgi:peptidoglycan/xylan/chitin deacetylase (PgdA/CDA1 family)